MISPPKTTVRTPKAVVVGLDGVPYTLLKKLADQDRLPHMSSIFRRGYFGQMSVSIPEISSVSWSSFMTGEQPGKHGIFGFVDLQPGTYKMRFPSLGDLKAPTIWDDMAARGKRSVVINMPATYPAREINGVLVSGFVAIDMNKAVYPPSLIPRLKELGYRIDVDTVRAREHPEILFQELHATIDARERVAARLWEEVEWDLLIVVVTGTDRLMHFQWDSIEDENHPHHQRALEYLASVDGFVGRMHDRFSGMEGSQDGKNLFCMLSDHGFTGIKSEVYLNRWLQENGFLRFQKDQPETIADIGTGSRAFALDPSRVYINLKEKYPLGTVDSSDYEQVRLDIKAGLEGITFQNGDRAVNRVYLKEEIYNGPCLDRAPDLVAVPNDGYDLKGRVSSPQVFARTNLQGMHTGHDAFFFSSSGVAVKTIFEIKRLILDAVR